MYRHNRSKPLDRGNIRQGQIITESEAQRLGIKPKIIEKFLRSGTWVEVTAPPLSELPDFDDKAELLAGAGIFTLTDLIEAENVKEIARQLKKTERTLRKWQQIAAKYLDPNIDLDHN